jgi:hypothetical protein
MEDGDTYDMPFRDRPEGNPRYKMVADVAVKVKDKRYLGRLCVTTELYDGPEYQLSCYGPSQYSFPEEVGPGGDVPFALSKVPFLKEIYRSMYMRREDFEVLEEIYVVHGDMFLECKVFFLEGMTGIYAIQHADFQNNRRLGFTYPSSWYRHKF